ncbi:MAG: hypothetical protein AAF495_28830 [Pseudomonadota bacterium]
MSLLSTVLPDFAKEVDASLRELCHKDLADQLGILEIAGWCHDPAVDALYITLAGQRPLDIVEQSIIGPRHEELINLEGHARFVNVDVDNFNRVTGIEVIGTRDVLPYLKQAKLPEDQGGDG